MLQLEKVHCRRPGGQQFAAGVTLDLKKGEAVLVCGDSAVGKSSLMALVYGELAADSGSVRVCGLELSLASTREIDQLRREIGVLFQPTRLLPNKTVLENVMLPLEMLGWSRGNARDRAASLLEQIGLGQQTGVQITNISGAERKVLAVARALVNEPELLLLDEPLMGVTGVLRRRLLCQIAAALSGGCSILACSQDKEILTGVPHRCLELKDGILEELHAHEK